jgi:hypothetical protein
MGYQLIWKFRWTFVILSLNIYWMDKCFHTKVTDLKDIRRVNFFQTLMMWLVPTSFIWVVISSWYMLVEMEFNLYPWRKNCKDKIVPVLK